MLRFGGGVDKHGMLFCMVMYSRNTVVGKENITITGQLAVPSREEIKSVQSYTLISCIHCLLGTAEARLHVSSVVDRVGGGITF